MELIIVTFCVVVVWYLIGIPIAKRYHFMRHGVSVKVINGGFDRVVDGTWFRVIIWPLLLILPHYKDPDLCTHPSHVAERARQDREYEEYQAQLRREGSA